MQDDEIRNAVANDLGVSNLSPEEQQKIINQFGEVALKAVTIAIFEKLPEEKREEFATTAQSGDPEALQAFLDRELPNHEEVAKAAVEEEVRNFKEFQAAQGA